MNMKRLVEEVARIDEAIGSQSSGRFMHDKLEGTPGEAGVTILPSGGGERRHIKHATILSHDDGHTFASTHGGATHIVERNNATNQETKMHVFDKEIPHLIAHLKRHYPEHF